MSPIGDRSLTITESETHISKLNVYVIGGSMAVMGAVILFADIESVALEKTKNYDVAQIVIGAAIFSVSLVCVIAIRICEVRERRMTRSRAIQV
ncbi:MAG: hypothetical protein ACK5MA_07965 [Parachlamydiaceae bacterium]